MERLAAVLLPIRDRPPYDVIFIERAAHLRRHAGEIAFPGGAVDAQDAGDQRATALRETHEEIGLEPAAVHVIGRLQPLRQRVNAFTVTAFVGVVESGATLALDAAEVAAVYHAPLAAIVAPGAVRAGVEAVGARSVETLHFDYGNLHVWGLTARILAAFVERYHAPRSALRVALEASLAV